MRLIFNPDFKRFVRDLQAQILRVEGFKSELKHEFDDAVLQYKKLNLVTNEPEKAQKMLANAVDRKGKRPDDLKIEFERDITEMSDEVKIACIKGDTEKAVMKFEFLMKAVDCCKQVILGAVLAIVIIAVLHELFNALAKQSGDNSHQARKALESVKSHFPNEDYNKFNSQFSLGGSFNNSEVNVVYNYDTSSEVRRELVRRTEPNLARNVVAPNNETVLGSVGSALVQGAEAVGSAAQAVGSATVSAVGSTVQAVGWAASLPFRAVSTAVGWFSRRSDSSERQRVFS